LAFATFLAFRVFSYNKTNELIIVTVRSHGCFCQVFSAGKAVPKRLSIEAKVPWLGKGCWQSAAAFSNRCAMIKLSGGFLRGILKLALETLLCGSKNMLPVGWVITLFEAESSPMELLQKWPPRPQILTVSYQSNWKTPCLIPKEKWASDFIKYGGNWHHCYGLRFLIDATANWEDVAALQGLP